MVNYAVTLASIILTMLTCPVVILMNVLVIVAVKTRPRLQSVYNILLASMALTDLLVGTVSGPSFIVVEIFAITGGSVATYCYLEKKASNPFVVFSILASLFHLVLISIERYFALKYALRYTAMVTKFRMTIAVVFVWFLTGSHSLFTTFTGRKYIPYTLSILTGFSLLVIVYCHIFVYVITRRHEKQISTEQFTAEAAAKFLEEKKAWKTTTIIIGFLLLFFLPGLALLLWQLTGLNEETRLAFRPVLVPCSLMLNSLCNPIIYCWRSKTLREAMIALIRKPNQN